MRLSEPDYELFLDLHISLLVFAGKKYGLFPANTTVAKFREQPDGEAIMKIREKLYTDHATIDEYSASRKDLSIEQLAIVQGFKQAHQGRFFILKHLKKGSVFFDEKYAFLVNALSDPLEWVAGSKLPLMVDAVLLPFKNKIVYDGFIAGYNMYFGSGIKSSLNNAYNVSKARHGWIEQLPIPSEVLMAKVDHKATLEAMMKTQASRKQNYYETEELLENHPELWNHYHFLWGKINSRKKKKALKEVGVKGLYFAIYDEVILASGKKKAAVEKQVKQMISADKLEAIYYFKV